MKLGLVLSACIWIFLLWLLQAMEVFRLGVVQLIGKVGSGWERLKTRRRIREPVQEPRRQVAGTIQVNAEGFGLFRR